MAEQWTERTDKNICPLCSPHGEGKRHLNFIAVEPIVGKVRCYSELEQSELDEVRGKRFWFSDELSETSTPQLPWNPTRGRIEKIKAGSLEVETLTIVVNVEKMVNGSHPSILCTFRADRPNEVGFQVFAAKDSAPMATCILTATMGNFARCRHLWLKDEVVESLKLWPTYTGDGFVGTPAYPAERMLKLPDGSMITAITPNETDPASDTTAPGGWRYRGKVATQYWRKYPSTAKAGLQVKVNGRACYWASKSPIPGGVAYENFELVEKFEPGVESWFGVSLKTPKELGWPKGLLK